MSRTDRLMRLMNALRRLPQPVTAAMPDQLTAMPSASGVARTAQSQRKVAAIIAPIAAMAP